MFECKITSRVKAVALGSTLLAGGLATAAIAQSTTMLPVGANTERASQTSPLSDVGFSISVDNAHVAGAPTPPVATRSQDLAAYNNNLQVSFDGLSQDRLLNLRTADLRTTYRAGETVSLRSSMNYPAFVERAEILVLDRTRRGHPVLVSIQAQPNGTTTWVMSEDQPEDLAFVLRVYDKKGRSDETFPTEISRRETASGADQQGGAGIIAAGEGEDGSRVRRIPLSGGTVTVSGSNARPGSQVRIMGDPVPVDAKGRFVTTRILPAGDQIVSVEMNGQRYIRDVSIPNSDWFHVGIVDITAGQRRDGSLGETDSYVDGRAAVYAKGKTQSGWTITGSLDTGEGPIEDIFKRLNEKDPRRVLDRLRTNDADLYPTYGDDSTAYDDTPSSGRVYLRAENGTTRLTWGDFKAGVNSGGLISNTRDLYGAELRYQTPSVTAEGQPRLAAQVYAANPETAVQRDVLRGTGGSAYFLTRQDISVGSMSLAVQTVDPDTGRVIATRQLVEGKEYRLDHMQGVLLLTAPLGSGTSDGGLVSDGSTTYDQNLIAQYEYTPTGGVDGVTAYGGRVETWVTDKLRFGVTAMHENTSGTDQKLAGADLHYQLSDESYATLELAHSDGASQTRSTSTDGGLSLTASGGGVASAKALRFDSHFALKDLGIGKSGWISLYGETKEAGFSNLNQDISHDQSLIGLAGEIEVSETLTLKAAAEKFDSDSGEEKTTVEVNAHKRVADVWVVGVGVESIDQTVPGNAAKTGSRTDLALRLTYEGFDNLDLYGFGQGTLSRSGGLSKNNRAGLGFTAQITDKLTASAEYSDGDMGRAGAARLTYAASPDNSYYLGYELAARGQDGSRDTAENGTVVTGARMRNSDTLTSFVESKYDLPGARQSITNAYGVTYTPTETWSLGANYETGTVRDKTSGDFQRDAVSVGFGYSDNDIRTAGLRLEYRTEDGAGSAQDRDTWGLSGHFSNKMNDNWRFLANLDTLYSDSAQGDFADGEYAKFQMGYAYRPVDNERLNLLLGYTYLHDLPGQDQVTASGSTNGPSQKSHVLSINGTYDINPKLSFSGKLGYRKSEVAARGSNAYSGNTGMLATARLDWHLVHEWDLMAEGRYLQTKETNTDETGTLVGVYRHIGENAKIGVGYEWGSVSDDLTNLDYENRGAFLNIIAKF